MCILVTEIQDDENIMRFCFCLWGRSRDHVIHHFHKWFDSVFVDFHSASEDTKKSTIFQPQITSHMLSMSKAQFYT